MFPMQICAVKQNVMFPHCSVADILKCDEETNRELALNGSNA
jgi:hypothetical protein